MTENKGSGYSRFINKNKMETEMNINYQNADGCNLISDDNPPKWSLILTTSAPVMGSSVSATQFYARACL